VSGLITTGIIHFPFSKMLTQNTSSSYDIQSKNNILWQNNTSNGSEIVSVTEQNDGEMIVATWQQYSVVSAK